MTPFWAGVKKMQWKMKMKLWNYTIIGIFITVYYFCYHSEICPMQLFPFTAFNYHKSVPQFHCSGPYWESVVELVGEQRVGQLPEVQLAEGAHWVYILSEDVSAQIWDLFRVKLVPKQRQERRRRYRTAWESSYCPSVSMKTQQLGHFNITSYFWLCNFPGEFMILVLISSLL